MSDKWLSEIREIVAKSENKIEGVIKAREKREAQRAKKATEIKELVLTRLKETKSVISGGKKKSEDIYPKIVENGNEIIFEMPKLSEVNAMDLVYSVEVGEDFARLRAFKKSPRKVDAFSSTDKDYDSFVKDTIKRFILAWYSRKLSDELDKEREFVIKITSQGL